MIPPVELLQQIGAGVLAPTNHLTLLKQILKQKTISINKTLFLGYLDDSVDRISSTYGHWSTSSYKSSVIIKSNNKRSHKRKYHEYRKKARKIPSLFDINTNYS